jgi:hypothetical protein
MMEEEITAAAAEATEGNENSAKKPLLRTTATNVFGEKNDDFSEDEDAPLNDDNLAELREEQVCALFLLLNIFIIYYFSGNSWNSRS